MIIDAGEVLPGPTPYRVIETHKHSSLAVGDIVRVTEYRGGLVLVREDYTIHALTGKFDQYVHLEALS